MKLRASRCLKMKKHYKEADFDIAACKYSLYGNFFPSVRQFVIACLQKLGVHCLQSSYGSMPACLGIAYHLGCPIATMSSKYYLISRPTTLPEELKPSSVDEVQIVDLTKDFYQVDTEDGKAMLKLRVFHPEMSALRTVPAVSRPLIAVLMNSDLLHRLPSEIKCEPSSNSEKLRAVVDWVSKTNPIHVLRAIMESITDPNFIDYISSNVLLSLEAFCPDFVEASDMLAVLGIDQLIVPVKAPTRKLEVEKWQLQRPSSPMFFFETASRLLKGGSLMDRPLDFLYRWPTALVHLYRFGFLEKFFIVPLYSELGLVLNYTNDYLIELPSIYGPGRILRYLHYCLLMGVEESNGLTSKLIGLRPYAREICYEGHFRFKTHMLEVKPMHLPCSCSGDAFIYAFIGFDCTPEVPTWSIALVLSCVLWHQQKVEHRDCNIAECPLILSALLLAVVTHYNVECSVLTTVAEHYGSLKSLVLMKMEESGASVSPSEEKELMHSALELMAMYDHYVSLCRLLTALKEGDAEADFSSAAYNRFPPSYEMFPSLALLVYIASHLRCQEAPSGVAVRLWVVNAFLRTSDDIKDLRRLKIVVSMFSTLMEFASKVKLKFTPPTVHVADPPRCFLLKEERPPLRRNVNPTDRNMFMPMRSGNRRRSTRSSYARQLTERVGQMRLNS
ncbi:unnamed protein product [Hydatigera taeniaeformis]|uniref:XPG_I_2 domain-containing protein n=1 Tax=Hydatigena taeniaeformis TaxID=6205 RepID=A0A0R3WZQ4_HYDTA|nr:unnamed protein product [Hydatigera taeniaeformis]